MRLEGHRGGGGVKTPTKLSRESCLVKSQDADVISSIRTQISGAVIGWIRSKGSGIAAALPHCAITAFCLPLSYRA